MTKGGGIMSTILLERSLTGATLIIVILCLRLLFIHKLPKKIFLILWGISMLRLIVPQSILLKLNVLTVLKDLYFTIVPPSTDSSNLFQDWLMVMPLDVATLSQEISLTPDKMYLPTLSLIWFIGFFIFVVYFLIMFFKTHQVLKTALPLRTNHFIEQWLSNNKTFRKIEVMISDQIVSPIAYGILKPQIILPKSLYMDNSEYLKHILTHEKMHITHLDIVWKLSSIGLLCLYWFNPLVWIMFVFIQRDLELTCDERVLRSLGKKEKERYALSLIYTAEKNAKSTPFCTGFSSYFTKERIVSIMKFKRTTTLSICISAILIAGAVTVYATNDNQVNIEPLSLNLKQVDLATNNKVYTRDASGPVEDNHLASYTYEEYKAEMENSREAGEDLIGKGQMSREKLTKNLNTMQETLEDIKSGKIIAYKPIELPKASNGERDDAETTLFLTGINN